MLLDMHPVTALDDKPDATLANLELSRDLTLWHTFRGKSANLYNVLLSKLCVAVSRAAWHSFRMLTCATSIPSCKSLRVQSCTVAVSTSGVSRSWGTTAAFFHHISHIIGICPKKQVGRIDTGRIITPVQDVHSVRDGANAQLVGNTMRSVTMLIFPESPVTLWASATKPGPASFLGRGAVNLRPEALLISPKRDLNGVPLNKACMLPLDGPTSIASLFRYRRSQATATVTQSRGRGFRQGTTFLDLLKPTIVPTNESVSLTPNTTKSVAAIGRDARSLTTPTLTKFRRWFVEIKRQLLYLIHVNSPLLRIGRAPDVTSIAGTFRAFIIPRMGVCRVS